MHYNIDDFLVVPGYSVKHMGWENQTDPDSFSPFKTSMIRDPLKVKYHAGLEGIPRRTELFGHEQTNDIRTYVRTYVRIYSRSSWRSPTPASGFPRLTSSQVQTHGLSVDDFLGVPGYSAYENLRKFVRIDKVMSRTRHHLNPTKLENVLELPVSICHIRTYGTAYLRRVDCHRRWS